MASSMHAARAALVVGTVLLIASMPVQPATADAIPKPLARRILQNTTDVEPVIASYGGYGRYGGYGGYSRSGGYSRNGGYGGYGGYGDSVLARYGGDDNSTIASYGGNDNSTTASYGGDNDSTIANHGGNRRRLITNKLASHDDDTASSARTSVARRSTQAEHSQAGVMKRMFTKVAGIINW